jgi:MFS family permease
MRRIHFPVMLANVPDARARAFVVLFTCDALTRSILITLVPLQAYHVFGAAQTASVVYFFAAAGGLGASLCVPGLLAWIPRRFTMTIGAACQLASVTLLMVGTPEAMFGGLILQAIATAMLEVVINLYMMDHVPRRALNTFEPRRLLFTGSAFAIGPWLGIYLHREVADGLTHVVAILATLTMIVFFWFLRLSDDPTFQLAKSVPASPLRSIPRFARQPRLVLAWMLALGRNSWWVTFFIYTPIYVAHVGYSAQVSGAIVSLALAALFFVRVWGRIGARIGIRRLLCLAYGLTGAATLATAAAALAGWYALSLVLLWLAGVCATIIDGAGNVPFLRAVRYYERPAMTSVFMTFRHVGSLAVPGILAVVLWFAPLPWVFAFSGSVVIATAFLSLNLPRGL